MEERQLPHHSDEEIDLILAELDRMGRPKPALVPEPPEKGDWKRELLEWGSSLGIAVLTALLLFGFLFRFVTVEGVSMEPTLQSGDQLVMQNLFYEPDNGDIVILSDETGLGKPLVKRIIATGGQSVALEDGIVYVDGQPLTEPYVLEDWTEAGDFQYPLTVPEGCVFVMGDNRNHSTDSRSSLVGMVLEDEVLGRIIFRLFPFSRIGIVK